MMTKGDSPLGDHNDDHLADEDKTRLHQILSKFPRLFDGTMREITLVQNGIYLEQGYKPGRTMPYRTGLETLDIVKFEVERMLEMNVIGPYQSERSPPVVLVSKANGSKRFCVYYRRLNKMTIRHIYSLSRMDECIYSLGEAQFLITLDCLSGFSKIEMKPEDMYKTNLV